MAPAPWMVQGVAAPSYEERTHDAMLSRGRMCPDRWFGSASDIIQDELGEDAELILGMHADTVALFARSVLQAPKGESGLRDFLRHLRDLLGVSPSQNKNLIDRMNTAEERFAMEAKLRVQSDARARAEYDMHRARWLQEKEFLESTLAEERASRAAERKELIEDATSRIKKLMEEVDTLREGWHHDAARSSTEIAALTDLLQREQAGRAYVEAEVIAVRRRVVERDVELSGLNESLRVGAAWLGGRGREPPTPFFAV